MKGKNYLILIFGTKCSEMSGNNCLDFEKLLENLWKSYKSVRRIWKIVQKVLISLFI